MRNLFIFFCLLIIPLGSFEESPGGGGGIAKRSQKGELYIITIGIDRYVIGNLSLKYCRSDAERLPPFFEEQFKASKITSSQKPFKAILLDSLATFDAVDRAFKEVIKSAKPDDYFIFSFAGLSLPQPDGDINFYLSGSNLKSEFKNKEAIQSRYPHFNLVNLKNWLNLISARNQMIISEAGVGDDFAKNLEKVIMGTDPIEALLSDRNRVILSTNGYGTEGDKWGGGPLGSYLMNLRKNNVFDFFDDGKRKKVEFELLQNETNGAPITFPLKGFYSNVFYESELLSQLKSFKDVLSPAKTRGGEAEIPEKKSDPGISRELIQNYALIIAINDYDTPSWRDLTNPITDARAVESDLKNLYGFKTEVLTNPTKSEISKALYRYSLMEFDSVKSQLLIFWAGHGGYDEFVSGYLVAKDSKSKEEDPLRDTYLEHSKLRNMLTNIKCPHVMLVLDACFGGTFDQKLSKSGHRGEKDDPIYAAAVDEKFIQRKLKNNTRIYLTSGGKEYVPDGRPGQHSPFARQFLDLLRNAGGADKILTFNEIKSGLERVTPEPCAGEFDGNQPGSDFLFILKN